MSFGLCLSCQGSSQTERFNDLRSQHLATTIENELSSVPYLKTLEDVGSVILFVTLLRNCVPSKPMPLVTTISTCARRPHHALHP